MEFDESFAYHCSLFLGNNKDNHNSDNHNVYPTPVTISYTVPYVV